MINPNPQVVDILLVMNLLSFLVSTYITPFPFPLQYSGFRCVRSQFQPLLPYLYVHIVWGMICSAHQIIFAKTVCIGNFGTSFRYFYRQSPILEEDTWLSGWLNMYYLSSYITQPLSSLNPRSYLRFLHAVE